MYAIETYYGATLGWRLYTPNKAGPFRVFRSVKEAQRYVKSYAPPARYRYRSLHWDDGEHVRSTME